jgi:hypothetical protein
MRNRKLTIIIIGFLLILTAILSVVHLTTREQGTESAVQVMYRGKNVAIALDELKPLAAVRGTIVDGKGQTSEIDATGILVSDVLALAGVSAENTVTVTADDEYSVTVTADETEEAWLIIEEDSLRLIVFGDPNSKRNVRNVVRLTVE